MLGKQSFPVKLYSSARKEIESVSTLCFPSRFPLDEKGVLVTSVAFEQGSLVRAESKSNQKYRSWTLIIGELTHQKGNHCFNYEVSVVRFTETKLTKK